MSFFLSITYYEMSHQKERGRLKMFDFIDNVMSFFLSITYYEMSH
jgi:hypothetical protein